MVTAIIQARFCSSRLKGKCLLNLEGKPVLEHIIDRISCSKTIKNIIIATTTNSQDDKTVDFAQSKNLNYFRGSENNVLDRFYQAAKEFKADTICRVTSDDPFKDPEIIDIIVNKLISGNYDYVSNTIKPTYPEGLDIEVFTFKALEKAREEAKLSSEKEHVTPYIWKNPNIFNIFNVKYSKDLSKLRWTLDYPEDWKFVQKVYKELYKSGKIFLMKDILELLDKKTELKNINSNILRNEGYLKSLKED